MRRLLLPLLCAAFAPAAHAQIEWRPIGPGAGSFLMSIAIQPDDADIVYVGGDIEGLFKSTDGGQNWINAGPGVAILFQTILL